jgi:hypothetical protein
MSIIKKYHTILIITVTGSILLILHFWSLMRYPAPFVDEAWLTSRAWAFLHTGHQLGSLDMGVAENLPGGWVANQWLITALQSICLRIAGQPSLFAVRLLSLGWGVLLIAATFQIGRQIFSKATALFGGMLLAFSISFFYSAHSARYDIMAASLGYCAVAFYFSIKNDSLLNGLWIGLLVSMAVETHLNSLIFGVAVLGMFIVDNGKAIIKRRQFWGYALGGTIGFVSYLALHVIQFPETFIYLNRILITSRYLPAVVQSNGITIQNSLSDIANLLYVANSTLLIFLPFSIIHAFRNDRSTGKRLAIFSLLLFFALLLLIRNKFFFYSILIAPVFFLLNADYLIFLLKKPWKPNIQNYLIRIMIFACVIALAGFSIRNISSDQFQKYQQTQNMVNQYVEPGDTILGTQVFWFGLAEHPYFSWELLEVYPVYRPGESLSSTLMKFKPNIIVLDEHAYEYILYDTSLEKSRVSRTELESFLTEHAVHIAHIDGEMYSPVDVYRLDW